MNYANFPVVWVAIGLFAPAMGTYVLMESYNNPTPHEMTCAEFYDVGAPRAWVTLTDCEQSLWAAIRLVDDNNHVEAVFIPVYPVNSPNEHIARLVMRSKDDDVIATVSELNELREQDYEGWVQRIDDNNDIYEPKGTIEGLIGRKSHKNNFNAAALIPNLDDHYELIQSEMEPRPTLGLIMIFTGLLSLLGAAFQLLRS